MTLAQQQKANISNTILVSNVLLKLLSEVSDSSAVQLKEQLLEYQRNIITTVPPPTQQWLNKQLSHFTSAELFQNLVLLAVKLNDRGQQEIARATLFFLQELTTYRAMSKKVRVGKYVNFLHLLLEEIQLDSKELPGKFTYAEDIGEIAVRLPINPNLYDYTSTTDTDTASE